MFSQSSVFILFQPVHTKALTRENAVMQCNMVFAYCFQRDARKRWRMRHYLII